jgi:phosphate starvation-inducible PhoH-like protein
VTAPPAAAELDLEPADNTRLANLCGQLDEHLRYIEDRLGVDIAYRGSHFRVSGDETGVRLALDVLRYLFDQSGSEVLTPEHVHFALQEQGSLHADGGGGAGGGRGGEVAAQGPPAGAGAPPAGDEAEEITVRARRMTIRGRGNNQRRYLRNIREADLNFGVGPAGTGKTYLAVAAAVEALETEAVRRLVLVRPAVEAGERLGFLPGDMSQKVDPYLRPIYDALYEMLGFERVARLIERHVIEVAPLAFMRGRSLNEAFVILDEAQNTTVSQMKMFLTRIGFGTRAVVTGDVTQTDLPRQRLSGLRHALEVLKEVEGVRVTRFGVADVVRHPLVQRIVEAYERAPAIDDTDIRP